MISDHSPKGHYPLVVFLHGMGERGTDNEAQLKWGVMNFATDHIMGIYKPVVIAPQCPPDATWENLLGGADNSDPTRPMALLKELLDKIIKDPTIDTNRVYITGLSMGGYGTFDALTRYPDLFAAAVPVCGGGDISKVEKISHIPIWIYHGALDDIVPVERSIDMYRALIASASKPGLTIYPETGHFAWIPAYQDQKMMAWLFSQIK